MSNFCLVFPETGKYPLTWIAYITLKGTIGMPVNVLPVPTLSGVLMSTRRKFIRNAGALTASGLVLPGLDLFSSRARAQGAAPKRFVVIMGAMGMRTRLWVTGTPSNYELGRLMQPISRHKRNITFLRGIRQMYCNHEDGGGPCVLTGDTGQSKGGPAKHASIDQVIAANNRPSAALSTGEFLRSIQCGVGVKTAGGRSALVHSGPGKVIAPENDPGKLFDRIFNNVPTGGGSTGSSGFERQLDLRQRFLDIHKADLDEITKIAGKEDKVRLEQHTDAITTLENEIDELRGGEVPVAECSAPNRYGAGDVMNGDNFGRIATAHTDIISRAFACDVTRVASLQLLFDGGGGIRAKFLGSQWESNIHDGMHMDGSYADGIEGWYIDVLGQLMDRLDVEDPFDPNGNTILHNTTILFTSNLVYPSHNGNSTYRNGEQDTHDHPLLIAGRGGGYFRNNQMLDFRQQGFTYGQASDKGFTADQVHNNRLLVSILNAHGQNVSKYGQDRLCQGGALDGGLLA